MAALRSVWWLLVVLTVGAPSQSTEQWFPTGVPELTSDEGLIALMTWSDYSELAKSLTGPRQVVLIERPPSSERARFGVNFVLGGRNRALAVDGSDEAGYRFYGDTNADGNGDGAIDMGDYIVWRKQMATDGGASRPPDEPRASGTVRRRPNVGLRVRPPTLTVLRSQSAP